MEKLKERVENYKKLLRIAGVPELLIENPELIISYEPPTADDIVWAKKEIEKIENKHGKIN